MGHTPRGEGYTWRGPKGFRRADLPDTREGAAIRILGRLVGCRNRAARQRGARIIAALLSPGVRP